MKKLLFSAALLSVALIAFQLVLMQILSFVQWYHFAYMVISVALLGFGASGTVITLAREWLLKRAEYLLPLLMILSGAAMALVVRASQTDVIRFDSYLLFVESDQAGRLVFTYLTFFIPFFLGALALGLIFVRDVERMSSVYFANLVGSGVGGLVALVLLWFFLPHQLPSIVALFPIAAALFILPSTKKIRIALTAAAGAAISLYFLFVPPELNLSDYKNLRRTLNLPDANIMFERSSPYGLVQIVSSPALRYAPGLSLTYADSVPSCAVAFNNGDWFGPLVSKKQSSVFRATTLTLPYVLKSRQNVLVLHARTGIFVAQAMSHGARNVTAVEPHGAMVSLMQNELAHETDSLFLHPTVTVRSVDSRTWLMSDTSHYDLIVLPTLDAFGGTSGLYATQEQYLLTKEAIHEMWTRLAPDGVLSITSWMDYPLRNPLRAAATLVETLNDANIANVADHIAAIRSWGTITFVVKRTPLTRDDIERMKEFCEKMLFDPALMPQLDAHERNKHNILHDATFFKLLDDILSLNRRSVYAAYDFNIEPTTDNRPYFSQFLLLRSVPRLRELLGQHAFPFLELGSLIIAVTLVQISVLAVVLIVVPLFLKKIQQRGSFRTMAYFASLGVGYMFVEIVLIQWFTLYLGHPLYATAAVISAMLIFSGAGSLLSSRFAATSSALRRTVALVAIMIVGFGTFITPLLHNSIGMLPLAKIALACCSIAPLAFVMGMPFPLGMKNLAGKNESLVPWAWGINGCMSVIAAPLATVVAVEWGFAVVMLCAAAAYLMAGTSLVRVLET